MESEKRPKWINFKNFLRLLNCYNVKKELAVRLSKYLPTIIGYIPNQKDCEDLSKKHLPILLKELRMYDIKDINYWIVSFAGVAAFLGLEMILLIHINLSFTKLILFITIPLIGIIMFYLIYMVICLKYELFENKIKNKFLVNNFFTIPAIILSVGLIIIHSLLIANSGWKESPFLPSFMFVNLTIVTAPRENSQSIIVLTVVALLVMFSPYYLTLNNSVNANDIAKFSELSVIINISTLIFTILIVFISRFFSSYKIIKK